MADLVICEKQDLNDIANALREADPEIETDLTFAALKTNAINKILSTKPVIDPTKASSWTIATNDSTFTLCTAVDQNPHTGLIVAGHEGGAVMSYDGKNWISTDLEYFGIAVNCLHYYDTGDMWLAGTDEGLYWSYDGEFWQHSDRRTELSYVEVYDIDSDPFYGQVFVASSFGVFFAESDTDIIDSEWQFASTLGLSFEKVFVNSNANGIVLATGYDGVEFCYYFTPETFYDSNIAEYSASAIAANPSNGNHVILCSNTNGIYYSTNGGSTFIQAKNSPNGYKYSICYGSIVSGSNPRVVVGCDRGITYSDNDGADWTSVSLDDTIISVHYGNGRWLACAKNKNYIYMSIDGETWTKVDLSGISSPARFTKACYSDEFGLWMLFGDAVGDADILYAEG